MSLCLLMPSVLCIGGFGELGEQLLDILMKVIWLISSIWILPKLLTRFRISSYWIN